MRSHSRLVLSFHTTLIALLLATGCVPHRKYEELNGKYNTLQAEAASAEARAREAEAFKADQEARINELDKRLKHLQHDTSTMGTSMRQMRAQYDKLNDLNSDLLDKYSKIQSGDKSENRKLLTSLEELRLNMIAKEDSLNTLARSLQDREAKLHELQTELDRMQSAMRSLKDKVSKALVGFEGSGLTIEERNGRLHVSMENKLLFPSGSATVDAKGRDAIIKLAKAIENEKDLNILVEGHTDTDKIQPGSAFKDNWDLSVMRATSVVRILQENSRLAPVRVTAAGRGEYLPVDPADKAKNRRIEIILAPDLKELYTIVRD
ncbi:MAG: OmpA family protein [Flavobacteriales bacterium]|nr:OmpA family protein [Flavobacteriales bacterium]